MAEKSKVYSQAEAQAKIAAELPNWHLENGSLSRALQTDGWQTTMQLVNMVGFLAEAAAHHPDLSVSWAKLYIRLQTHDQGGITDKDFELAAKIEQTVFWKPAADSALAGGTQAAWVRSGEPR